MKRVTFRDSRRGNNSLKYMNLTLIGSSVAKKSSELRTDEKVKQEILQYLQENAKRKDWKIVDFTLFFISEYLKEDESRVNKILDELESRQELIKTSKIDTKIYLPQTKEGERISKTLAGKKLILPISPHIAFIVVIISLYLAAPRLVSNVSDARQVLALAFLFGLVLTFSFNWISKEYIKWKVTSEKQYRDISRFFKFTLFFLIALLLTLIGYFELSKQIGSETRPEIIATIIGIFLSPIIIKLSHVIWRWGK